MELNLNLNLASFGAEVSRDDDTAFVMDFANNEGEFQWNCKARPEGGWCVRCLRGWTMIACRMVATKAEMFRYIEQMTNLMPIYQ